MTIGEKNKNQIAKFFSTVATKITLNPENRPYIFFRSILLVAAILLVCVNWYISDRRENYQIGTPSAKTYFALTTARYEDRAATLELRQRAAARIVDVMVQDEKIAAEVNKRLETLSAGDYASIFNKPLLELFKSLSDQERVRIIASVLEIGGRICD